VNTPDLSVVRPVFSKNQLVRNFAVQVFWYTQEGRVQGIKTLVSQKGSISIKFDAAPQPDGVTTGHFIVIDGSGAYKHIHGQGDTYAALSFGTLPGQADPVPTGITGSYTGSIYITS
jgi:hypothetical protein